MSHQGTMRDRIAAKVLSKRARPASSKADQVPSPPKKKSSASAGSGQDAPLQIMAPPQVTAPPPPAKDTSAATFGPCSPPLFFSKSIESPGFGSRLAKKIMFPTDRSKLGVLETEDLFGHIFQLLLEGIQTTQIARERNSDLRGLLGEAETQSNLLKTEVESSRLKVAALERAQFETLRELEELRKKREEDSVRLAELEKKCADDMAKYAADAARWAEEKANGEEEMMNLRNDVEQALDGAMRMFNEGKEAVKDALKIKYPNDDFEWVNEIPPTESPVNSPQPPVSPSEGV